MHGPIERRWGGGGRWPGLTLKIANSIGNKQLSSTTTPEKCWTPFETKKNSFLRSHCKQIEDIEPTVDKFEDQKVDKAFFCQILPCPPSPPNLLDENYWIRVCQSCFLVSLWITIKACQICLA